MKPGFAALVVDDDAFSRRTAVAVLRKLGASTLIEAADGGTALRHVASRGVPFDLIICDLKMPEVDGIETLRLLAGSQSAALVLLVSRADQRIIRSAAEMVLGFGIQRLRTVGKPITAQKLRDVFGGQFGLGASPSSDDPAAPQFAFTQKEMRQALFRNEFVPYFQPKVNLRTRRITGAEALVRWHHPRHGTLAPASFLLAAQEFGLLYDMSCCMLAMAAARCVLWRRSGIDLNVSINLPVSALASRDAPRQLQQIVERQGLMPEFVIFEVTEDGLLNNQSIARENLTRLRLMGFGLSIDDFGTGYASVQQLLQAPFNEMKIDQSFVRAALNDEESAVALASSIALARNLGLSVVGEGVTGPEHWTLLLKAGCDLAQGYHIARPMPGSALVAWAETWNRNADTRALAHASAISALTPLQPADR